jgi:transposase, IS30 family
MPHLTYEERCQISIYLKNGFSRSDIASLLDRDPSVISRELKRNSGLRGYRVKQAHEKALERRSKASSSPKKMTPDVIHLIKEMLQDTDSSPQQISGRLEKLHGIKVSHESIYLFIWANKKAGGQLYLHLRHRGKKYNKRSGKKAGRGLIPNRVDIDQRPTIVEKKERFGDFELDTIVGANHKGAIVSIVDRASKCAYLVLVQQATAENIHGAVCKRLNLLAKKGLVQTYTADNGKEFSGHEKIVKDLGGAFYFAKPYHSWERGLNEHTNGLVRQYFPKGTEFRNYLHS